ncbi:MAG: zinc/manganese transporter permease [Pelagibacteraceae bacterium]|nr:zinc/manganese transporter permease [Pelagibacteraceae bacterium]|tara:strand:+ start:2687 stop:3436 length:750 start_codon:yes stop_codon:yes gene_type:complete
MISNEMIYVIGPAFLICSMIVLTHVPLGIEVLKRGIIFIDLAIAQVAGLGLIATNFFFIEPHPLLPQLVALTCAILAGLLFHKVEIKIPKQQEAIIGVTFIFAASIAILLLANHPSGGEEIRHLLSGQILFVTWLDVAKHTPIYILILAVWFFKKKYRNNIGFYLLFALAVTSSVQLVGIYVVFASLILPALAVINISNPYKLGWLCGIISVIAGIFLAILFDAPAGPVIVTSYVLTTIIFLIATKTNR